jgi:hypothetical protein
MAADLAERAKQTGCHIKHSIYLKGKVSNSCKDILPFPTNQ